MNFKMFFLLFCFSSTQFFTQNYYGRYTSEDMPKVEFTLEDGKKASGFFVGYTYPNGTYPGFFDKHNIYNFVYKKTKTSADDKFGAEEVKSVKIFDNDDDVTSYIEKLEMKYVDKDGKVEDKKRKSFEPLLYDGKIQIFGSNLKMCGSGRCNYLYSQIYIRNAKDNFALMPVDYDKMSIFNFGSLYEKMVEAFRDAGRDCKEFQKYLDGLEAKLQDKEFRKQINQMFKDVRKKAFDDAKEKGYKTNKTQELLGDYMMNAYLDFYGGIIKEYEKNCP